MRKWCDRQPVSKGGRAAPSCFLPNETSCYGPAILSFMSSSIASTFASTFSASCFSFSTCSGVSTAPNALRNMRPFHIEICFDLRDARGLGTNGGLIDGCSVDRFAQGSTLLDVLRDERLERRSRFAQNGVDLLLLRIAHAQLGNFPEQEVPKRMWLGGIVCTDRPCNSDNAGERKGPGTR